MISFNMKFRFVSYLFLVVLLGCASQQTSVEYSTGFDFTQLQRFAIQASNNSDNEASKNSLFVKALIQSLETKGFILSSPEKADWVVNHYHYLESETNNSALSIGLGTGTHSSNTSISIGGIFQIPLGDPVTEFQSVQIDMLVKGEIIWKANGTTKINVDSSYEKLVQDLVDNVLSEFPPLP